MDPDARVAAWASSNHSLITREVARRAGLTDKQIRTDHGLRSAFEDDRERQNLLALDGWTILRFTWRQICGRPAWVADQVRRAVERAAV